MERVIERTEQNTISVRNTSNGYYEARISLKIGGVGKSNRLQKGGKAQDLAVLRLLEEIENFIDSIIQNGLINFKINPKLPQLLVKSINTLQLQMPEIMQKTLLIVNKINNFNAKFDNLITMNNNVIPFPAPPSYAPSIAVNVPLINNNEVASINNSYKNNETCNLESFAHEFMQYRLSLCKETEDNPRPLSQKTVDSNIDLLKTKILPFFKSSKILYLQQINENIIVDLLKSLNGYQNKRNSYIVLSLLFKYAKKQHKLEINPIENVDKPVKPAKNEETEIKCIEPENQKIYLDIFETENTDMSLLFTTMLLTGIRPEEACRFEMESIRPRK